MSRWLPLSVFLLVILIHGIYLSGAGKARCAHQKSSCSKEDCSGETRPNSVGLAPSSEGFRAYLKNQDYLMGISYAIALGFAAYSLSQWRRGRRAAGGGATVGIGISSVLLAGGCFLIGCCGSPMLGVWLSLFGAGAAGLSKPFILAVTALSVAGSFIYMKRKGADNCGCCAGSEAQSCAGKSSEHWIAGHVTSSIGEVPIVSTELSRKDVVGIVMMRIGIGRHHYTVRPGIYAIGAPDPSSPVLVSANYKLSFDMLRSSIPGKDAWIIVLDTKGINVWCAAGKGTFGTDELVRRIAQVKLLELVTGRRVIVPQLGAPGISAHRVFKESGFKVVYGPVRAADLPEFLDSGLKATPSMRKVSFEFFDRLVLIPVEVTGSLKLTLAALALLFMIGGIGLGGFSFERALQQGGSAIIYYLAGLLAGCVITPALLPWIPGRAFSLKGALSGLMVSLPIFFIFHMGDQYANIAGLIALCLFLISISSFFAMNFTGCTTFTSLSGVRKEMRYALPLQIILGAAALFLWKIY